jgi:hypothetical protein
VKYEFLCQYSGAGNRVAYRMAVLGLAIRSFTVAAHVA